MSTIDYYEKYAEKLFEKYSLLQSEQVHSLAFPFLPSDNSSLTLDIGSGSGRDSHWLAKMGYKVLSVEPSIALTNLAKKKYSNNKIEWINDSLPALSNIVSRNLKFDFILISAVLMHFSDKETKESMSVIAELLRINGIVAISIKSSKYPNELYINNNSKEQILKYSKVYGLELLLFEQKSDLLGREGVCWEYMVFVKS